MSQVFVIKTAGDCGHCQRFKSNGLEGVKNAMTSMGLRVVHVDYPKMSSPTPKQYPPGIANLSGWFPSFMVIPADSWVDGSLRGARVFPMNSDPSISNLQAFVAAGGNNAVVKGPAAPSFLPTAGGRCGGPSFRGHQN